MPDNLPSFEFSEEEIAAIRNAAGVQPESPITDISSTEPPAKRRRGRPRKLPQQVYDESIEEFTPAPNLPPAPLTRREEREVAERLHSLLIGATGIPAGLTSKLYLQMTEEEAKDIADPLASYLVRNAETVPLAREILENYDLAAIVFGVGGYAARVYNDRRNERQQQRIERPSAQEIANSRRQSQEGNNGREPFEGSNAVVHNPYTDQLTGRPPSLDS